MPETTTGAAPVQGTGDGEAQGAAPQAGTTTTTDTAQGATGQAQGAGGAAGEQTVVEALTAKVAALEKDNRAYRQSAAQREAAEKAAREAQMTEVERLTTRNAELEAALSKATRTAQEQSLRLSVVDVAQRLGYRNPARAMDHLLANIGSVTFDDQGQPTNVEKMLTDLAKSDPTLVVQPDFGGGQRGTPTPAGTDMNALIRAAARR